MLKNISMTLALSSLVLISQFAEAATLERKQPLLKTFYTQDIHNPFSNSSINVEARAEQSRRFWENRRINDEENERIRLVALELTSKRDYVGLGNLFMSSGRGNQAIAAYTKAIEVSPKDANSYFQRAIAKGYYLKDLRGAIADYDIVIALNPVADGAYKNRAVLKYDTNDKNGSLQDFRSAAKIRKEQGHIEAFKEALKDIQYFFKLPE
jgi:tetratricopeptide (TPR) repeat protein